MLGQYALITILLIVALLAITMLFYPFRHTSRKVFLLAVPILLLLMTAYWQLGSFSSWSAYKEKMAHEEQLKAVLATIKTPDELINKLRERLKQSPQDAKGWYLLGRLLASQHHWQEAEQSFLRAYTLNPESEEIAVNYAQTAWENKNQELTPAVEAITAEILKKNPQQPDILSLYALNAYRQQDYAQAIIFWQKLLGLVPNESQEAQLLRKAIVKAKGEIAKGGG